ncbi:MAG: hypothetical protein ACRCV9_19205 [Burkholderiaceae bacterium]
MPRAIDLIKEALEVSKIVSAGDSPSPDDVEVSFRHLNTMIDGWGLDSAFAYTTKVFNVTLTSGQSQVTIGPTGQIVTARPVALDPATVVLEGGQPRDTLLVGEQEFYRLEPAGGTPCRVFYKPDFPVGVINVWPAAAGGEVLRVVANLEVLPFADLTTDFPLPPGYRLAIVSNLAKRIAPVFHAELDQQTKDDAANSMRMVKTRNIRVPQLDVGQFAGYGSIEAPL